MLKQSFNRSCLVILLLIGFGGFSLDAQNIDKASKHVIDSLQHKLLAPLLHDSLKVQVTNRLAIILRRTNPERALFYAQESLKYYEATDDAYQRAGTLNIIGIIYQMMSNHTKAIEYYFKSLRFFEVANKPYEEANVLNNIGICYKYLERYELAYKYFLEAINIYNKSPETQKGLALSYNNIGMTLIDLGRIEEAITYFKKVLIEDEKYKRKENNAGTFANLGLAYTQLDRLQDASYYYRKALIYASDDAYQQIEIYSSLGGLYLQVKDFNTAGKYLLRAEDIAEKSGVKIALEDLYLKIASVYDNQANYKMASFYKDKFIVLKDSLYNDKMTTQINELQAKYDIEKKDEQIKLLNKDKELEKVNSNRSKVIRNFSLGLALLSLMILGVLYRNIVLKKRVNSILAINNKQLSEKNEFIEAQKKQIESINNELEKYNTELLSENITAKYEVLKSKIDPHFLFNSLTTLSAIVIDDAKAAVDYITQFARLYRMILETGEQSLITLNEELEIVNTYLYLQMVRHNRNIVIHNHIEDYNFLVPPFAIQMMVENAIKHNIISPRNKLVITIETTTDTVIIRNTLSKIDHKIVSTSIGQKNITERYKFISETAPVFMEKESEYFVELPLLNTQDNIKQFVTL